MNLIFRFLSWLNRWIPKSSKRILLYSNLGFRDNIEVLYRHFLEEGYDASYQIVCISNDFYGKKKERGIRYVGLYLGVFYFFVSKYFFYYAGKYPIKPAPGQMVVNLWHGIPLKKIGNLQPHLQNKDFNYFTKVVAYNALFRPIMKQAFSAREDQLLMAGNVRNDDLFQGRWDKKEGIHVCWLPTYRTNQKDGSTSDTFLFSMEEEWEELNSFLKKRNIYLYLKLHPLEEGRLKRRTFGSHIFLLSDEILGKQQSSLYQFLGNMDALITDYSSVYFDYLLLNRPIGFVVDDLEEYQRERGFVLEDVEAYMPGEKIYGYWDLKRFLEHQYQKQDGYQRNREALNERINPVRKDFCKDLLSKIGLKKEA